MKKTDPPRRFDDPGRSDESFDIVYGGEKVTINDFRKLADVKRESLPPITHKVFFGELHGHTDLSDGRGNIDSYFTTARDVAGLDFCALSDHDHGGVGSKELWHKWDYVKEKVREYHEDGRFVTILAYERDSHPWYTNLVLYYKDDQGEMFRGSKPGRITREELAELLARDDILTVPHTTSFYPSGCDFTRIPRELMTPLVEVYSRWGTSEYFGNPEPVRIESEGGFWQDALNSGAVMGCMAGSDDHSSTPGLHSGRGCFNNLRYENPGMTAVLAEDLTRESLFNALKERRCYGTNGSRIVVDFRINKAVMGQVITEDVPEDEVKRDIHMKVEGTGPIKRVSLIKNGREYIRYNVSWKGAGTATWQEELVDYCAEKEQDYYYLRVEQEDGGRAWTSPIWLRRVAK